MLEILIHSIVALTECFDSLTTLIYIFSPQQHALRIVVHSSILASPSALPTPLQHRTNFWGLLKGFRAITSTSKIFIISSSCPQSPLWSFFRVIIWKTDTWGPFLSTIVHHSKLIDDKMITDFAFFFLIYNSIYFFRFQSVFFTLIFLCFRIGQSKLYFLLQRNFTIHL